MKFICKKLSSTDQPTFNSEGEPFKKKTLHKTLHKTVFIVEIVGFVFF